MESHRTTSLDEIDELRNDLLGILTRTIHVVGSRDDDGQLVGVLITLHNELCCRLGSRIRIGRIQQCFFHYVILIVIHMIVFPLLPLSALRTLRPCSHE